MMNPDCTVCGSVAEPWMRVPGDWRRPDLQQAYSLFRCAGCGHGMLSPMPSAGEHVAAHNLDSYFTHASAADDALPETTPLKRVERYVRDRIAWTRDEGVDSIPNFISALGAGSSVYEIGAGKGHLGAALEKAGHTYVGVEIDDVAREFARQSGLTVYKGLAESVPAEVGDRTFDAVVMCHVLEHVTDLPAALDSIRNLLVPGGLFVFEVPNNAAIGLEVAGASWSWLDAPRHVQFFTPRSAKRLVQSFGFGVSEIRFTGYVRQFQDPWIEEEKAIRRFLVSRGWSGPRRTRRNAWRLIARTLLAPDERRYDSMMVISRKS